jgi:signal transduction histidine kinase
MSDAHAEAGSRSRWHLNRQSAIRLLELSVVLPTLSILLVLLLTGSADFFFDGRQLWELVFWLVLIALVELFPVPAWRSAHVSIGFPLLMAVAFVMPPPIAAMIALVGSSDPREFKGEVGVLRALFNRCQISISVLAASLVFHAIAGPTAPWRLLIWGALLAVLADYVVNSSLVSLAGSLIHGVSVRTVMKKLRIGSPLEFSVSYMGLGFLGAILARLHLEVGEWAVAAFVMPLLLARQMFFRTRALEDAARALRDREVVLRALSNRMAEERQDERMQIAGYLHDDLAQLLYRMSLHIDISEKHLEKGASTEVREELEAIRQAKDRTLKLIRSLIKDLHRSPLGRAGLTDSIASYCMDLERDSGLSITTDLTDVEMPPPIQLLCYQVTREALTNILKHAEATTITIRLESTDEGARLTIQDDGKGFDTEQGSPEGHFGLAMMRERAQNSGGGLEIESAAGEGTTVTAEFKTTWLADSEVPPALGLSSDDGA